MKTDFLDGLSAFGSAIAAAEPLLVSRPQDAAATVRRLARTMIGASYVQTLPEMLTTCQAVLDAKDNDLAPLVADLKAIVARNCSTMQSERTVILIVDDDPMIGTLLRHRLQSPTREIIVAESATQAMEVVQHRLISLVLLDLGLPDRDGRDVLAEIRLKTASLAIPILVLSAMDDPHVKMECFALGADAYFEKPVNIKLLLTVVAAKLQRISEIGRRLRHDPLTGALNRLSFAELFVHYSALASRTNGHLAIAILDLDHFKSVNDAYGHGTGDEVLRNVAALLERSLRKSDSFGRWGGEEFVVLLPDTDNTGAVKALQTVADSLAQTEFTGAGKKFKVSFSAGIAQVSGASLEEAVSIADTRLYAAKSRGRNCIVVS